MVRNWPKYAVLNLAVCCGAIWRQREKSQYGYTAQLQSLACIIAPKMFWKIYFLYNFWGAQTCSFRAVFGLPIRNLTIAVSTIIATCWKIFIHVHIYVLHCNLLRWNFLQISKLYTRIGAHKLLCRFWTFWNFLPQFRKDCGAMEFSSNL